MPSLCLCCGVREGGVYYDLCRILAVSVVKSPTEQTTANMECLQGNNCSKESVSKMDIQSESHRLKNSSITDKTTQSLRHHFFNQSNCVIYALIQSEMEPQTSGPSVRDNAIFKTMWAKNPWSKWIFKVSAKLSLRMFFIFLPLIDTWSGHYL